MDADLVLEGGGVKGIGLVGAYSALAEAGYTVHRIAGTSAGAIVGALIAAGMEPEELKGVMRTVDYGRFEDEGFIDHLGLVGKGASILFEKGIYEGRYLVEWLDGSSQPRRAHVRRPAHRGPELLAPAREGVQARRDDVRRHPGRTGAAAVGLPGVRPGRRRPTGGRRRARLDVDPVLLRAAAIHGRDDAGTKVHSFMVDGGMLSNFPIEVFDRTDGKAPRWPTFGIKLSAKPTAPVLQRFEVKGTFGLARRWWAR